MADSWDDYADEWDRNEQVRDYAERAFASLTEKFDLGHEDWRSKRILDFGCGTGLLTERLSPLVGEIVAVDSSQKMVMTLQNKAMSNVMAVCVDLDDDAVRSGCTWFSEFDLIVASSVCGFLPGYESTLKLLSKALVARGAFVQWDWLASEGDDFGLTRERVRGALAAAGFSQIEIDTPFQLTAQSQAKPVLMACGLVR